MKEVRIEKPFNLVMKVVDIDDVTPSFQMDIDIKASNAHGSFTFKDSRWIQCSEWDAFTYNLSRLILGEKRILCDVNRDFQLSIQKLNKEEYFIEFVNARTDVTGKKVQFSVSDVIDRDALVSISNAFEDFPRWWHMLMVRIGH
ncbi:hypothetical protein V6R21_23920 [Limibacter armeniacum]|uniref:hypothetical protein n=1 Tax=Limibacter armeniacum TaxID=466084 RepID=UPI002FE57FF6